MKTSESMRRSERGYRLHKTSETAVNMIAERITLENLGLKLKVLPLCTEQESVHIEELIPRARTGFVFAFKHQSSNVAQERDLIELTTPLFLENLSKQVKLTDEQNTLPEYWHVLATLEVLAQSGKVSFFQFPNPPANMDYETGMLETYWFNSTDSFEKIWTMMEELEKLTRTALYSDLPMSSQDILKVGHFFMTSKTISSVFDN